LFDHVIILFALTSLYTLFSGKNQSSNMKNVISVLEVEENRSVGITIDKI
jgi:hypothetical protein